MVVLVMVVLQIGFAGYGAFYAAHKLEDEGSSITDKTFQDGFGLHAGFGYLVILAGLVLMIIGLIAGIGKWRLGKQGCSSACSSCSCGSPGSASSCRSRSASSIRSMPS